MRGLRTRAASIGYVHQAELSLGTSAAAHEDLGNSVALSADGHIALVGAPGRQVNGVNQAGAAEVFRFQGGVWGKPVQLDLGRSLQWGRSVRGAEWRRQDRRAECGAGG